MPTVRSYRAYFSLSFLGVLVTDLSVGAPPAAEAHCVFFRFSERLSAVWAWRTRGDKLVGKTVTRQRSCAESTGRINGNIVKVFDLLKSFREIQFVLFNNKALGSGKFFLHFTNLKM